MSALRQVLGGMLALLLVGGALAASGMLAFTESGPPVAEAATATASLTAAPATLAPTASPTRPAATATSQPSATASATPTSTFTPEPSETLAATETASALPTPTQEPPTVPQQPTQCIPAPPAGWVVYIIRPGDTLGVLAQRFGVSLGTLQRVNCIVNASDIRTGQRIFAPNVSPPTSSPTPFPTPSETPADTPTIPADIPTITSEPVASATPDCVPPEFYDPFLQRCRLPDTAAKGGAP